MTMIFGEKIGFLPLLSKKLSYMSLFQNYKGLYHCFDTRPSYDRVIYETQLF